ncbi:unnamed protein product [Brassica oleracea]|uniref:(rape) hypothetical protein n=1 Tax=Brassica napus TaxID=3708 RepID=A0A816MZ92_BRANA|nr:unnamed protein product [Brassica napus]
MEILLFENMQGTMKMKKRGSWYYSRRLLRSYKINPISKGSVLTLA